MTIARILLTAMLVLGAVSSASAETFEVKMRNRGDKGTMVFEPDYLQIKPGDRIRFIVTNKSHNAASIAGMVPQDYPGFTGKINEEIEVGFDLPGFYGIKCSPHFSMGMVMLVKVGDPILTEDTRNMIVPDKARARFDAIFTEVNE